MLYWRVSKRRRKGSFPRARRNVESSSTVAAVDEEKLTTPVLNHQTDPFRYGVAVTALVVTLLILLCAYFGERTGGDDEIGLFNPTYMDVHYGKMTYPVYDFFDSMPVHPPIHYKLIALFMRAGFTLYYAQATPTVLFLLLCVALILTSPFSSPVKIGLLFGLFVPYACLLDFGAECFGMRPEANLNAAWLAALLALESGRRANWNLPRLFLGAFLLTLAAGMHYYAALAALGALVYAACAFFELNRPRALQVAVVIAAGCLLYGIPELTLWAIPQRSDILYMIRGTDAFGGVVATFREHLTQYHYWAAQNFGISWLRFPFSLGLPVVFISTPIFLALRDTRVLAVAALPLQLFLLFFAWHKHEYYFIHELALYDAAMVAAVLTILSAILRRRFSNALLKHAVGLAATGLLVFSLWRAIPHRSDLGASIKPQVHEQDVARAAAREIVGDGARVGSRLGMWYAAGAADWYNVTPKLLWSPRVDPQEAVRYLSSFDAVAESMHMSNATSNSDHKVLLSWYLDGTLKLRGFFFAESNGALSYLLLEAKPTMPIRGFGLKNGRMYRFIENPSGNYELAMILGPQDNAMSGFSQRVLFTNTMILPSTSGGSAPVLLTAIVQPGGPRNYQDILPNCRVVQRNPLVMDAVDEDALIRKLRREDRPIRFHRSGEVPD